MRHGYPPRGPQSPVTRPSPHFPGQVRGPLRRFVTSKYTMWKHLEYRAPKSSRQGAIILPYIESLFQVGSLFLSNSSPNWTEMIGWDMLCMHSSLFGYKKRNHLTTKDVTKLLPRFCENYENETVPKRTYLITIFSICHIYINYQLYYIHTCIQRQSWILMTLYTMTSYRMI